GAAATAGEIYGGELIRGSGEGYVQENKVTIDGGTIFATIYGGYAGVAGANNTNPATGNQVLISGGGTTVTGNIYGGYSAGRGNVTQNIVDIDGATVTGDLYGGYGNGNVFDGNVLNLSHFGNANIGSVRNFEDLHFKTGGIANIGTLYTTATGSTTRSGIVVNTHGNEVTMRGLVTGTGNLTLDGPGTLNLTHVNNTYTGLTTIRGGGFIGFAGANSFGTGRITLNDGGLRWLGNSDDISGRLNPITFGDATFDTNGNDVILATAITNTGGGDIIKAGQGKLTLTADGNTNGDIVVSDGTLQFGNGGDTGWLTMLPGDFFALDTAQSVLAFNRSDDVTVSHLIAGPGKVVQRGTGSLTLTNTSDTTYLFTGGTEIESGTINIVNAVSYGVASAAYVHTRRGHIRFTGDDFDKDIEKNVNVSVGSFQNTFRTETGAGHNNTVNLNADTTTILQVVVDNSTDKGGVFYVADGTSMTVNTNNLAMALNRGRDKNGVLRGNDIYVEDGGTFNLHLVDGGTPVAAALFMSGIDGEGTLNISSDCLAVAQLNSAMGFLVGGYVAHMGTTNVIGTGSYATILDLSNVAFTHSGDFNLLGNGNFGSAMLRGNGTVKAQEINVTGRAILTLTDAVNVAVTQTLIADTVNLGGDKDGSLGGFGMIYQCAPSAGKTSLLDIQSDDVWLRDGIVALLSPNLANDYLVIQTTDGFKNISTNVELNAQLRAEVDGFLILPTSGSPRGTNEFKFGDASGGKDNPDSSDTNVWFTNTLNSLTMTWTGGTGGSVFSPLIWGSGSNQFISYQGTDPNRETQFLPGDKVHFSGAAGTNTYIEMGQTSEASGRTVVSGLVVGQNATGSNQDGSYTFSGSGGFMANASNAFGDYVRPDGTENPELVPTGKLEKYGTGTLTFQNTGGNYFADGIDLYGGTIAFNRADQLQVGTDQVIAFKDDAALSANAIVALATPITVAAGTTAMLHADINAASNANAFLLSGTISREVGAMNTSLVKTGTGIVQLEIGSDPGSKINRTTIEAGNFRIVKDVTYMTDVFEVNSAATLSGKGTIKANQIKIDGNLSPDSDTFSANHTSIASGSQYGTLTLDAGSVALGSGATPFTMDFDVALTSTGNDALKDLLVIKGNNNTVNGSGDALNGTINFHGTLVKGTDYLIVQGDGLDSTTPYNLEASSLNDCLKATLNGAVLALTEPRGGLTFRFGDDDGPGTSPTSQDKNIWLTSSLNSLTMNWTGGTSSEYPSTEAQPHSGYWYYTPDIDIFNSLQTDSGNHTKQYMNSDEVLIYNPLNNPFAQTDPLITTPLLITLAQPSSQVGSAPMNAYISRLAIGAQAVIDTSTGERLPDRIHDGHVRIAGTGSIHTVSDIAFGVYLISSTDPNLKTSGKLEKYGRGTLILDNMGANSFEKGILLNAGTIYVGFGSSGTGGLSQALGFYDMSLGVSGKVEFSGPNKDGDDDVKRTVKVEGDRPGMNPGISRIQNYFLVSGCENNTFHNEGVLTISGVVNPGTGAGQGGAFFIDGSERNASLTIEAQKHLTLVNNGFWVVLGGSNFVKNDILLAGGDGTMATLNLTPLTDAGIFVKSGIASAAGNANQFVNIDGLGFVQIEADSAVAGTSTVNGTLRIVDDKTYGSATHSVNVNGTLAGNGTLHGSVISIRGTISPDADKLTDKLTSDNTDIAADKRYATLTLESTTSTTLDDFTFKYSVNPNGASDLLEFKGIGDVLLKGGTVDFYGSLTSDKYLIMRSIGNIIDIDGKELDGINDPDGILKATRYGKTALQNGSPRGIFEFVFKEAYKEIWLETEINSLTMTLSGTDGDEWTDNIWESKQSSGGVHETMFNDGDLVKMTGSFTLDVDVDVITSGLDVFGDGHIVLTGIGGITADEGSAFGRYLDDNKYSGDDLLEPTGKLVKSGDGTLTFANNGNNLFREGIDLHGGTVQFGNAKQLGPTQISFKGNATLFALDDVTLRNVIEIDDDVIGSLGVAEGKTMTYAGALTGTDASTLDKSGLGTLWFEEDSDYIGKVTVSQGLLFVASDYGKVSQFNVGSGAMLAGTGTIGGPGVIHADGTLKPRGETDVFSTLTINGDLTFASGSEFNVYIARDANETSRILENDSIVVNGSVHIDPRANLQVTVDYWRGAALDEDEDRFTIIDTVQNGGEGRFTLLPYTGLPRGVTLLHGWDNDVALNEGDLYQLWFEFDPTRGFGNLCIRQNRSEIGKTLDWFIANTDESIRDLIDHLSSFEDREICDLLDHLHGDLTPNAMFMALKEPWRHPFNRLTFATATVFSDSCSPCAPLTNGKSVGRQLWGEFTARYENVGFDKNAHAFTINRYGLAVGVDQQISHRSIIGATFQYAEPRLRQATGKVVMEDTEFGFYSLTRLADDVDVKAYLGYSFQNYSFDRYVLIPAVGRYDALNEHLRGKTGGDALATSVELSRTIAIRDNLRLTPLAAFDYERVWMRGFRESGGLTSLVYDRATLDRMMIRIGGGSELAVSDRLALNARLQYAMQLNDREYPAVGARFVNGPTGQYKADIWGSQIGRDYLNLGVGTNWQLGNRGDRLLYVNYDTKLYNRATFHAGEAGFVRKW
ncbi:MAG: autotransporter domain-containing protein, partial [Planctomycetaceae bacterium]|nr:autotransporter domain-containing protein [Planctomycetaceae bacterium]